MTQTEEATAVEYRDVPGHDGYLVGDDGSVWSDFGGRVRLSTYRRPYGASYRVVCLRANRGAGKVLCRYVHRLVLEAFVGRRHVEQPPRQPRVGDACGERRRQGTTRHRTPRHPPRRAAP